jgi:hypothetical protein
MSGQAVSLAGMSGRAVSVAGSPASAPAHHCSTLSRGHARSLVSVRVWSARSQDALGQGAYAGESLVRCFRRKVLVINQRSHACTPALSEKRTDYGSRLRADCASEI